jgi:hypothetical protein
VVASVLARLRNTAKSNGAPFQQVLQQYAIERFLYRISKSRHAKSVILKGALLLKTIGIPTARPTLDIDMLRMTLPRFHVHQTYAAFRLRSKSAGDR